jgi:aryl-alcohol dehydrogenase-like predicted oxidoreductase
LTTDSSQDRLNKSEYFQHYKVDRAMQIAQVVVGIANELDCSAAQVALFVNNHLDIFPLLEPGTSIISRIILAA